MKVFTIAGVCVLWGFALLLGCKPKGGKHTEPLHADCQWWVEKVDIRWTAFKTTEKIAVGGTFSQWQLTGTDTAETPHTAIARAEVKINTKSVSSGDSSRDARIARHFFGVMDMGEEITARVLNTWQDSSLVEITINGIPNAVIFRHQWQGDTLTATATIDLTNWDAQAAVDSLNRACYDLHKGPDGVSKLWSEVDLNVRVVFGKQCPTAT